MRFLRPVWLALCLLPFAAFSVSFLPHTTRVMERSGKDDDLVFPRRADSAPLLNALRDGGGMSPPVCWSTVLFSKYISLYYYYYDDDYYYVPFFFLPPSWCSPLPPLLYHVFRPALFLSAASTTSSSCAKTNFFGQFSKVPQTHLAHVGGQREFSPPFSLGPSYAVAAVVGGCARVTCFFTGEGTKITRVGGKENIAYYCPSVCLCRGGGGMGACKAREGGIHKGGVGEGGCFSTRPSFL